MFLLTAEYEALLAFCVSVLSALPRQYVASTDSRESNVLLARNGPRNWFFFYSLTGSSDSGACFSVINKLNSDLHIYLIEKVCTMQTLKKRRKKAELDMTSAFATGRPHQVAGRPRPASRPGAKALVDL